MKTLVVNEIDPASFHYYVEYGTEFDNDDYEKAFNHKFNASQVKKINALAAKLQEGEFLRVEH